MLCNDKQLRKILRRKDLVITPKIKSSQLQPASIDLTLDRYFLRFKEGANYKFTIGLSDPKEYTYECELEENDCILIQPGEFLLASTKERVELNSNIAAQIDGRSSIGRLGIGVHVTAGWIDPGFKGKITLEIYNVNSQSILIPVGYKVCQLIVFKLSSKCKRSYGSKQLHSSYQNQYKPRVAKNVTI